MTKPLFALTNILLITAAAFFSVQLFYRIVIPGIDYTSMPVRVQHAKPISKRNAYHPLSHYDVIVKRNLFKTKIDESSIPISVETLDNTQLDVKLWGTVTGDIKNSFAIIEKTKSGKKKSQDLYHVGDVLQNAVIEKILREKVILDINGENKLLEMEKRYSSGRRNKNSRQPVRQRKTIRRALIENAAENVNKIMTQAKIRPHAEGLNISRIRPGSIFRKLGLRNGDIITGVDGRRIESVDDALSLYQNLRSASRVTLELKRRGRARVINYTIR